MHSRSNLRHSNVTSTYYASKKYLNNLTFNNQKIDFSNPAKLSGSGGIFAGAGFRKSVGFRPELKSGTALARIKNSDFERYPRGHGRVLEDSETVTV